MMVYIPQKVMPFGSGQIRPFGETSALQKNLLESSQKLVTLGLLTNWKITINGDLTTRKMVI